MIRRALPFVIVTSWLVVGGRPVAGQATVDLNELQEKAIKAAVQKVAPSVVQIETSGGTEVLSAGPGGVLRKGVGPTTGLVVSADGYIISSAFNFANKPSFIIIAIVGQKERLPAKIVATDQTRMLTLLKVEAKGLPVPAPTPKKEIKVGQWSVAVGRTLDPQNLDRALSVSVGITSAVNRIWGKAIQTDAKVSPANYGGPLIDVYGRVQGVLVPASPRGEEETAGVEWYDSGIGFAIPLEDINAALPRLKEGKDLKRGLLGITLQSPDMFGASPVIATVAPESAAARADIRAGDIITEIDGKQVINQAQILHILGAKYEGDAVSVKIRRGKEERNFPNLKLTGVLTAFAQAFVGVVPVRDDPELGEEIRYVFPKSPADTAAIKPGDRIMKAGLANRPLTPFSGRDQFTGLLNAVPPGTEIKVEVQRKGGKKTETLTIKLTALSDEIPDMLPEPASHKKALAPRKTIAPQLKPPTPAPKPEEKKDEKKKPETGLMQRSTPNRDHEYWVYVPDNYDPNIAHAFVIWLHAANGGKKKDIEDLIMMWSGDCKKSHIILLAPK